MTKCDDGEIKQSLADRLRALQVNQENWKNRINKTNELEINKSPGFIKKRFSLGDDIFNKKNEQVADQMVSKLCPKVQPVPTVQSKLADRMLSLEKSAKQWRSRVADKDNQKFTISGKMASQPLVDHQTKNNRSFNSKVEKINRKEAPNHLNLKSDSVQPKTDFTTKQIDLLKKHDSTMRTSKPTKLDLNKSDQIKGKTTLRTKTESSVLTKDSQTAKPTSPFARRKSSLDNKSDSTNEIMTKPKSIEHKIETYIPKLDDSLDKFFRPIILEKIVSPSETKDEEDFLNEIDQMNSSLLVIKKNVKLKNRKASSGNPLKKMQNTTDFLQNSYSSQPIDSNCVIGSPNRSSFSLSNHHPTPSYLQSTIVTGKLSSTIRKDLDPNAQAGLKSKEDYQSAANKLKKSSDTQDHLDSNNLLPKRKVNKCLIQVKGRKKVQVRLVDPNPYSINEGDSYILITNDTVIVWLGRFTNIIERTKAIDVGNKIYRRKELGFTGGKLIIIDNDKQANQSDIKKFNDLINDQSKDNNESFVSAGNEEEDELYENQIIKTNKVYVFDQDQQVFKSYEQMCSRQLYQQQLNPYDAFFFDFDYEAYVWLGFHLTNECRSIAIEQAQKLYSRTERSAYSVFYKCNQNMEMITFQEKFFDWITNCKPKNRKGSTDDENDKRMNLKTFDVNEMLRAVDSTEFLLDNTNIGRGDFYKDENELLYIEVVTDNIKCWHVNENEKREIKSQNLLGKFFDTETYVVRWEYRINRLGNLDNKKFAHLNSTVNNKATKNSDHNTNENIFKKAERVKFQKHKETLDNNVTGRERYCYFYWQGSNCSIANKGAAALMAIELDKEKGTQIQVKQSEEPACFLRLFRGEFVIFNNQFHQNDPDNKANRLFLIKGVYSEEAFLYEVECDVKSLRSKGCFVVINFKAKKAFLWIGRCVTLDQIKIANDVFQKINEHCFLALDPKQFNASLSQSRSTIRHLINYDCIDQELSIFYLSSLSGDFTFKRLVCSYSSKDVINNFPFEQKQLYSVSQPAFFLVDNGQMIYLWQGHFPLETEDQKLTGSVKVRYSQEKKCALETVLSYCYKKYQKKPVETNLIHAGLEPIEFIQLFPEWTLDEEIREIQLKDGKRESEMNPVSEVLARVCNRDNVYKLKDLQKTPLPDAINPLIIETYLSDDEFENVLGMTKKNFYLLPLWKQNRLKQNAGLF